MTEDYDGDVYAYNADGTRQLVGRYRRDDTTTPAEKAEKIHLWMNRSEADVLTAQTARCEKCGSTNLELDGWDIDKCRDCGHWHYR